MSIRLEMAFKLARHYHQGQVDKGGESSYSHVVRVSSRLKTESEKIVALLHDVLEDTKEPKKAVFFRLCEEVFLTEEEKKALILITRDPADTYFDYIRKLEGLAVKVKIADIEDHLAEERVFNLSESMVERYEKALSILK